MNVTRIECTLRTHHAHFADISMVLRYQRFDEMECSLKQLTHAECNMGSFMLERIIAQCFIDRWICDASAECPRWEMNIRWNTCIEWERDTAENAIFPMFYFCIAGDNQKNITYRSDTIRFIHKYLNDQI